MVSGTVKDKVKNALAAFPFAAGVYWRLFDRGNPPLQFGQHNSLDRLEEYLPDWCSIAAKARQTASLGKDLLIFATFRYWIEQTTLLGLTLSGLGHNVTLVYLPYAKYKIPSNRFDLQRQDVYLRSVLSKTAPLIKPISLFNLVDDRQPLPQELRDPIEEISKRDTQYSLRIEEIDPGIPLYQLRLARNEFAARAALTWLKQHSPEVVIIPNGSILEYGVFYHAARYLNLPIVTFEFDEPQHRIRLAHNAEVMREDTDDFWKARRDLEFNQMEWDRVRALLAARQGGDRWENFPIQFQDVPRQGEEQVRSTLGLDARPIVLLAPNVFGDSATLSRQIFSHSMSEWLERTVHFFARRPDVQLVIRIHPSEMRFPYGTSMQEVVRETLPSFPENVHLIQADAPINTYDIVEIADLGLVYTTTVGMEMAMSGVPVVVAGFTHYRGKGFTIDPNSWEDFFERIDQILQDPSKFRLTKKQIKDVWHYAYRFFFEFTRPFPWHLLYFWDDVEKWPLDRVLATEGQGLFGDTIDMLTGEPLDWSNLS